MRLTWSTYVFKFFEKNHSGSSVENRLERGRSTPPTSGFTLTLDYDSKSTLRYRGAYLFINHKEARNLLNELSNEGMNKHYINNYLAWQWFTNQNKFTVCFLIKIWNKFMAGGNYAEKILSLGAALTVNCQRASHLWFCLKWDNLC